MHQIPTWTERKKLVCNRSTLNMYILCGLTVTTDTAAIIYCAYLNSFLWIKAPALYFQVSKIKRNISLASEPVQKPVLSQEKIEAMKRMAQQLSKQIASGNITPTKTDTCSVPKKKKKHKRRKSALFEGREVSHLVRQETFKQAANDGVDHAKQDEYILKKLFSKSGKWQNAKKQ